MNPSRHSAVQFLPAILTVLSMTAVVSAQLQNSEPPKIRFDLHDQRVTVKVGDEVFTELIYHEKYAKPIFYPIYGPGQVSMTRSWPMKDDVKGEAHDHPHHKSLWFSHEINGIDFWSEKGGTTKTLATDFETLSGPAFRTNSIWVRRGTGETVFSDLTIYRFGSDEDSRWIDAEITIQATHGDVTFDDTKEGTFALRTHPDLRLSADPKDGVEKVFGQAYNSNGETGKTIWGKSAKWVMYGGPIDGTPMSIAIFDHPSNLRHPTTWHAREYGLVAANPFGLHYFKGQEKGTGAYTIKNGGELTLKYRALFMKGVPDAGELNRRFDQFAEN